MLIYIRVGVAGQNIGIDSLRSLLNAIRLTGASLLSGQQSD